VEGLLRGDGGLPGLGGLLRSVPALVRPAALARAPEQRQHRCSQAHALLAERRRKAPQPPAYEPLASSLFLRAVHRDSQRLVCRCRWRGRRCWSKAAGWCGCYSWTPATACCPASPAWPRWPSTPGGGPRAACWCGAAVWWGGSSACSCAREVRRRACVARLGGGLASASLQWQLAAAVAHAVSLRITACFSKHLVALSRLRNPPRALSSGGGAEQRRPRNSRQRCWGGQRGVDGNQARRLRRLGSHARGFQLAEPSSTSSCCFVYAVCLLLSRLACVPLQAAGA
jgi:hypothetical protein